VTKKGKEGVKGGAFRSDTPNAPIPRNDLKKKKHSGDRGSRTGRSEAGVAAFPRVGEAGLTVTGN
jgi:hypothetical protein